MTSELPPVDPGRPPRAPLGIIGAGQLARMTYQAGISLGLVPLVLATAADESAALVARDVLIGAPDDPAAVGRLVAGCEVTTLEHELVPAELLGELETTGAVIRPSAATAAVVFDKRRQRAFLDGHGLPVPAHGEASCPAEAIEFASHHGWPVVLKSPSGGYDGRGVWILGPDEVEASWPAPDGAPLLVEAYVPIERELAVVVARRPGGEAAVFPLVETVQTDGICTEVVTPARVEPIIAAEAAALAEKIATALDVVGILAVELFLSDGCVLVNELAVRPHNSGHVTIEACETSQFENHVRAVLDLPLGDTTLVVPAAVMVNLLGPSDGSDPAHRLAEALAVPGVHVHLYGKESRAGRKLGHVTARGRSIEDAHRRAWAAAACLGTPVPAVRA